MKRLRTCLIAGLAALALAGVAQGTVVVSYDANSQAVAPDPFDIEGGFWDTGGANNIAITPSAGSDAGGNYWWMFDDNVGGTLNAAKFYSLDPGAGTLDPSGWTATAVLKVNSASETASGVTLEVRGGGNLFNLSLVNNGINEYVGQSVQGNTAPVPIANVDLHSDFRTLQMYFDPTLGTAGVYVDGSLIGTISPGISGVSRILWGSNTSSATGDVFWREVRLETGNQLIPPVGLEGDLDGDGFVGITDLNIVLGVWNQNVTPGDPLQGDASGDGFVGIEDLNIVLGNWNAGTPPSARAVPEPATLALLSLGCLVFTKRHRAV